MLRTEKKEGGREKEGLWGGKEKMREKGGEEEKDKMEEGRNSIYS